jgi:hypothetical protein
MYFTCIKHQVKGKYTHSIHSTLLYIPPAFIIFFLIHCKHPQYNFYKLYSFYTGTNLSEIQVLQS